MIYGFMKLTYTTRVCSGPFKDGVCKNHMNRIERKGSVQKKDKEVRNNLFFKKNRKGKNKMLHEIE